MRTILAALSLALLSGTALADVAAPQYSSIWSVGDSLSDTGRTYNYLKSLKFAPIFPKGSNYDNGRFSNGAVWLEYLSKLDGLTYDASRNLSWGGAVTGTAYRQSVQLLTHLEAQVAQFSTGLAGSSGFIWDTPGGAASNYGARPLVTLWIGGNNFRQPYVDADSFDTSRYLLGLTSEQLTSPYYQRDLILKNIPDDLKKMNDAFLQRKDVAQNGVTYYVMTLPDASTSPKFSSFSQTDKAALSDAITTMNRSLKQSLYDLGDEFATTNPNTRLVVVDTAALFREIQINPSAYGFKDVTHNCVDSETGDFANGCNKDAAAYYLFWDQFHPTTAGHQIIAEFARNSDLLEYGAPVTLTMPHVASIEIRDRTYFGTIGGSGSLIKQGEATLTLAGQNTYTGGTTIRKGTVSVSSDANLGDVSGLLTLNGGAISASSSFTMQRNVRIGAWGGTFDATAGTILTLASTTTLSGDSNLTKTGAGTVDLRSAMDTTANTMGLKVADANFGRLLTTVAGGTLKINTTNSYITYRMDVNEGATLGGSGRIVLSAPGAASWGGFQGGLFVAGTLAPGNSIGTLTIDGDVTFTDSGVYQLEVDANRADHLVVNGTLHLDGTVQIVTDPTDKITTQSFTFATSGAAQTGTYDAVVDMSPFLSETLTYGANTATVQFSRDFAAPATTANQRAVAAHLNAAYLPVSQGDLDTVFYGLDTTGTNAAGANALDQLSGASTGNLLTSSAIQNGQFTRALEDRMAARRAGRDNGTVGASTSALPFGQDNSGLGTALATSAAFGGTQAAPGDGRDLNGVSAWARVLGGPATIGGAGAYDMTGVGVLLGIDKSFGSGLAGLSLAYGSFNTDGGNGGNGNSDTYQVSVYGSMQMGKLFLDGTLSYARADYSTTRSLNFGDLYRMASGSSDGNDVSLSLKAGATFGIGSLAFEPSVGFDWYYLTRSAFTETNAGSAGLTVGSQTLDLVMPSVGLRVASPFNTGSFTITPEASARYYYNFGDTSVATTAGLIGAPAAPFTVESTGIGRNIGLLAAGVSAQQNDNLRVSAQYELQLSNEVTAQVFSMGLRYTW